MTRAVALIRGVGGRTAMKMAELEEVARGTGMTDVETLQVAGNVVFEVESVGVANAASLLREAILEHFGHDLPVIIREHEELVSAVERNPYLGTTEGRLIATYFLEAPPTPERILALDPNRSPGDEFVVDGVELFVRYADGQSKSKLLLPWFERGLDVIGTARNANTVAKLVQMTHP